MKIAYIAAGAGGMYCGSCIHDNTLAAALQRAGHDVALIPTYTPIRTDETSVSLERVFFGGAGVYLRAKYPFFKHAPGFIDHFLSSSFVMNWLSKQRSVTNARDLGKLTISILKGEQGEQQKELQNLIDWLKCDYQPDIVHITNSMLSSFAREIKQQLRVPVICSLQGEDLFLEDLVEPYKSRAKALLKERVSDVDSFVATSRYYADFMAKYLGAPAEQINVVHLGLHLQGHGNGALPYKKKSFVIGYLARVCPEKGLHILVEAFYKLRQSLHSKIQLKVAGYLSKKDEPYFAQIQKRVAEWGLDEDFEYIGEVDRLSKIVFMNSLDVFSVPTVYKESKGLSVLEAMANGVPVVQPDHGLFTEIVETTQGGILVKPESPAALAEGIRTLYEERSLREKLGKQGKLAVHERFSDNVTAAAMLHVYKNALGA
ncbi:MAG: glycosyltransferase family 4 protein [bacterium]